MPIFVRADTILSGLVGTVLHESDTVTVSRNGQVTLLFNDGAVQEFQGPTVISIRARDPQKKGLLARLASGLTQLMFPGASEFESVRLAVRGPDTSSVPSLSVPILIYPPSGTVLMSCPERLAWLPITGATSYKVSVYDKNSLVWQGSTRSPVIPHPFDSLTLPAGGVYFWQVQTDFGQSSIQSEESVFRMIDATDLRKISDAVSQIRKSALDPRIAALLEANVYRHNGMLVDEMRSVDAILTEDSADATALILKGRICEEMNLFREAAANFRRALRQ